MLKKPIIMFSELSQRWIGSRDGSQPPLSVLVIKKVRDATVTPSFIQLVRWFIKEMKNIVVFVDHAVLHEILFGPEIKEKLKTFAEGTDDLTDQIDFIVCLGGDGTLLYASSLFQHSVPPIMSFRFGSLGFLTPFELGNFEQQITQVLEGPTELTLRSRLCCIVMKKESQDTKPATNLQVLNEVVIHRGPSPHLCNIDLYLDGKFITTAQGDGLIISTPTGSTAYAAAAGASMMHPSVPAIMVTPICPHSLSFRPIIVPADAKLKISVSPESRNTAWVSFDGRKVVELCHEDFLLVTTSIYPVPSISAQVPTSDWFASLSECLN
jgi:NAD+ kinase